MIKPLLIILVAMAFVCSGSVSRDLPTIHFKLKRRGDPVATHDSANLSKLGAILRDSELKYARTKRSVNGNQLVRRWSSSDSGTEDDVDLLDSAGHNGQWFLSLEFGGSGRHLEVDLDMLSPDFYILMTTSNRGSKYNAFSDTHLPNNARVHPLCQNPTDTFNMHFDDGTNVSLTTNFAICSPSKSSRHTILASGSVLGLSPPSHLSRLTSRTLLENLLALRLVHKNIFSLTLFDWHYGLLTIGSTPARAFESAKVLTELELHNINNPMASQDFMNAELALHMANKFPPDLEHQFVWSPLSGAHGLWRTLMPGLWVSGSKVLKNQPVLLDISCPFILAPPLAARRFYESIAGAKRLPKPHDMFFGFPCHNTVNVAYEFSMTMFPAFRGVTRGEAFYGPDGGRFSLGKFGNGSGYCVGIVVETRMGLDEREKGRNSGMRDVWILGEPFFRGMGVVLDIENERLGFRTY